MRDFATSASASPNRLRDTTPIDRPVVCHADACCPNPVLDYAGHPTAHVDLSALGSGDRWADIAVASMSTTWNVGVGWDGVDAYAYGIEPDPVRLDYCRRLWNET